MRMMIHGRVLMTMLAGVLACGDSPSEPSGAKQTMAIGGEMAVTAIGQTFQLAATVTAPNTAARVVTNEAQWASLDTSVATVTPGGLVTVVGLSDRQTRQVAESMMVR